MGSGTAGGFGCTRGGILDSLSDLLTLGSLIPGIDTLFDLAAIPVDLARGDFLSAGLDALGVIPLLGEAADAAKLAKMADNVIDATKAGEVISKASPYILNQTHKLTLSKKQYSTLVENIKKNGIKEPIKYVEYKGEKYVVDGHHRLQAAKQLNLKDIPVQKVTLPYKGYKTAKDLFWLD